MKKRFLSILTALCLCLTLLPTATLAAGAEQSGILSYLRYYNDTGRGVQPYSTANRYHYIYFGQWDGKPIKWRVLEVQDESTVRSKLLLLADECLGDGMPFDPAEEPGGDLYDGSAVQTWCENFYNDAFTAVDRALILPASKTEGQYADPPCPPCTITGEYVFAPSVWEINNADYGFTDQNSRAAGPVDPTGGTPYWLRSYTGTAADPVPAFIDGEGRFTGDQTGSLTAAVRPAMELNSGNNSFCLVSAAEGVKSAAGTEDGIAEVPSLAVSEWKLTLWDSSRRNFDAKLYDAGSDYYLAYTGAVAGDHEYVSAWFTKAIGGSTVTTHYGRLGRVTDSSGTIKVAKADVPSDETFWLYNEQYNGDKFTDYASNLVWLNLENPDICVPAIEVTWALTGLTIDGTPYAERYTTYKATLTPEQNYMLPETVTVTAGGTPLALNHDYTYDPATGKLKVLVSQTSGALNITADGVETKYGLSFDSGDPAAPGKLDFGTADYGASVSARTVTLTNTGNQPLTVNRPAPARTTDFEVEPGSGFDADGRAALAPGETAAFAVRPADGLRLGSHTDSINISTDNQTVSGSLDVSVAVQEAVVNLSDIEGVAAPAAGAVPAAAITETDQYTGTVTWSPDDAAFAAGKQYTATITLAPKLGYTFAGVPENFFKADGATCTNTADGSVITAVFPAIPASSGGSSAPTYPVFVTDKIENGSVSVSPRYAERGDTVTITVKPDSGYELEMIAATEKNGNDLKLTDKGDGKYIFTMPAGKVDVNATFMEDNSLLNFFYDVPNGAYYYEAVKWAVENGITGGIGNNLFGPDQPCTRAQIVTFLWRAAGSPEPMGEGIFSDIPTGSYYAKAVAWAVENGITTGTSAETFSPDATCSRAQAVTLLARALNAKAEGKTEFTDVPTNSYFADVVAWAAANGVTTGIGRGFFGPDDDCTRAQIVTFLWRAYTK